MRWSALKKQLMPLFDDEMAVTIHLTSLVRAKNQGALTHLGRLEIRAKGQAVWLFPDDFKEELKAHPGITLATLMGLLHTYLLLPSAELLTTRLQEDPLLLIPTLACLDRRVGKRRLRKVSTDLPHAMQIAVALRLR